MKSRRVIRLTEGDLHRIIRKTVNRLNEEDKKEKGWTKSYDEWSETYGDKEKGEKLSDDWHEKLKKEYPDKKERRKAIHRHCKELDVKNGKTGGKWDKYDKDMNESVRRNVRRTIMEHMFDQPWNQTDIDGSVPEGEDDVFAPDELYGYEDISPTLFDDNDEQYKPKFGKDKDHVISANDYETLNFDDFYPDK